jgi:hypothetical protein
MPTQTQVTTQPIAGPYPATLPVPATSLDLVFTAADPVNGNYFTADQFSYQSQAAGISPQGSIGGDYILLWNQGGAPATVTITSQPLNGRSGDIVSYSIAANTISAFKFSSLAGWQDNLANVYLLASAATVFIAVLQR